MGKFCSNCGKEVKEGTDVCLNCGVMIKKDSNSFNNNTIDNIYNKNNITTNKIPGKGLSIAGMIVGIYSVYGSLYNFFTINTNIIQLKYIENQIYQLKPFFRYFYFTLSILFRILIPIIGLVLSFFGYKKYKSGFNKSGLILNTIALCISICVYIYVFFTI